MTRRYVFGYGSLVNRATHEYAALAPARLAGWRRAWRRTPLRERCYLTLVPDPGASVLGATARVALADWAGLDEREGAYARHDVSALLAPDPGAEVMVYVVPEAIARPPGPADPLVLSYIDTVAQGFFDLFGAAGVAEFFATTEGWEARVIDDRATPLYARTTAVTPVLRAEVDAALARLGVAPVRR